MKKILKHARPIFSSKKEKTFFFSVPSLILRAGTGLSTLRTARKGGLEDQLRAVFMFGCH
ncbi:hypothetical protein A3G50_02560 [Candidatus Jorgensenbacteria bacterium RIFCSPLOWO2_12_FULL_42_11]|uniref:Uncharacterized protein n=1 Tax=Candidatus Jorgensenbacteria bacterium RIFCSPLOWO2_12_FULL_42_11 TaxID=1798473 RepID=A0A1F6C0W2_9BACT|nr:MAG: hypothetical protein A3G50_02560 [Candidatus Jorgensenbacteria bacterium RIFCSPLOWO2_12_FULL_42_11]